MSNIDTKSVEMDKKSIKIKLFVPKWLFCELYI